MPISMVRLAEEWGGVIESTSAFCACWLDISCIAMTLIAISGVQEMQSMRWKQEFYLLGGISVETVAPFPNF